MLLMLTAGSKANSVVHMDAIVGRAAIEVGTARELTAAELEEIGADEGYRKNAVAYVVEQIARRRGGWPKGKLRGPRKTQTLL